MVAHSWFRVVFVSGNLWTERNILKHAVEMASDIMVKASKLSPPILYHSLHFIGHQFFPPFPALSSTQTPWLRVVVFWFLITLPPNQVFLYFTHSRHTPMQNIATWISSREEDPTMVDSRSGYFRHVGLSAFTDITFYWQLLSPQIAIGDWTVRCSQASHAEIKQHILLREKWGCGHFSSPFGRPEKISAPPNEFYTPLNFLNTAPGIDFHLNIEGEICPAELIKQVS